MCNEGPTEKHQNGKGIPPWLLVLFVVVTGMATWAASPLGASAAMLVNITGIAAIMFFILRSRRTPPSR